MLYYLFEYLEKTYQLPGAGLFQFITFRAALAVILSLFIATVYGKKIIKILKRKQLGEEGSSLFWLLLFLFCFLQN
jgi:phospho-N-acetylmuramoyl-pentapeptide-transferase